MSSKYQIFDRSKLLIKPLAERQHDLSIGHWLAARRRAPAVSRTRSSATSHGASSRPRKYGAARILMMGAHVIRARA